jgi:hypothetical protein
MKLVFPERYSNVEQAMESAGYSRLGKGSYGMVWHKPGQTSVVKLFRQDRGYEAFVRYCRKQRDNPHVPRFSSNILDVYDYKMIRIERLSKMGSSPTNDRIHNSISGFFYCWNQTEKMMTYIKKRPKLEKVLIDVKSLGCTIDMHMGNMMLRGRTVVITDPLC